MDHTAAWGGCSAAAYSDYLYAKERLDKAEELLLRAVQFLTNEGLDLDNIDGLREWWKEHHENC